MARCNLLIDALNVIVYVFIDCGVALAGCVKMTQPTAFVTAFLAWSLLAFPTGYNKGGNTAEAEAAVRWGSDYLLKLYTPTPQGVTIIYQVSLDPVTECVDIMS